MSPPPLDGIHVLNGVGPGQRDVSVTATATDGTGDTSEFSASVFVTLAVGT